MEDVGNSFDAASSELIEIKVNCDLFLQMKSFHTCHIVFIGSGNRKK